MGGAGRWLPGVSVLSTIPMNLTVRFTGRVHRPQLPIILQHDRRSPRSALGEDDDGYALHRGKRDSGIDGK